MFQRHRSRSTPVPAEAGRRSTERQGPRRDTLPARLPSQAVTTRFVRPY